MTENTKPLRTMAAGELVKDEEPGADVGGFGGFKWSIKTLIKSQLPIFLLCQKNLNWFVSKPLPRNSVCPINGYRVPCP